eukprot:CAMPEP_0194365980 /NCGR_PEP_ID=MMETSP0174-20130528/13985_1 /TAXON_ID=216777 /ORGANISM="Proboscia alata, Strain PI-D3" /LENGTH=464 /DNA_ID=CAMNT_0039140907 /DNA_START=79 /DNA_END=1473 /DNA_ORIENTATION=+
MTSKRTRTFLIAHCIVTASNDIGFVTSFRTPSGLAFAPANTHHRATGTRRYLSDGYNTPDPEAQFNPELEFIDYDDPNYQIDQGLVEGEFTQTSDPDADEAEIEEMREYRRKRNDEYQFETYFEKILRNGEVFRGVWTSYATDTFLGEDKEEGAPRIRRLRDTKRVISTAEKRVVDENAEWRGDREAIFCREQVLDEDLCAGGDESGTSDVESTYWPAVMKNFDFRGPAGIMCVGGLAYTICDAVKLATQPDPSEERGEHDGPFKEYRFEIGIQTELKKEQDPTLECERLRIKMEYLIKDADLEAGLPTPPLHLATITVCRELMDTLSNQWPEDTANPLLFREPLGADGGLYDPPPLGPEAQASQYLGLDLEGGASILLPHTISQNPLSFVKPDAQNIRSGQGQGWVASLDWTPPDGKIRYQVDRKMFPGKRVKGLKSLELTEVQASEADKWRPTDGGKNMGQF